MNLGDKRTHEQGGMNGQRKGGTSGHTNRRGQTYTRTLFAKSLGLQTKRQFSFLDAIASLAMHCNGRNYITTSHCCHSCLKAKPKGSCKIHDSHVGSIRVMESPYGSIRVIEGP